MISPELLDYKVVKSGKGGSQLHILYSMWCVFVVLGKQQGCPVGKCR
jgi:hypothetical protein